MRTRTAGPAADPGPPATPVPAASLRAPAGQLPLTQCLRTARPAPRTAGTRSPAGSIQTSRPRARLALRPPAPCSSGFRILPPPPHLRKPQTAAKQRSPRPPARPCSASGISRPASEGHAPPPAPWTVQPETLLPLSRPPGPTGPPRPQRGRRAQSPWGFPKARVPWPSSHSRCPMALPLEAQPPRAPSDCLVRWWRPHAPCSAWTLSG